MYNAMGSFEALPYRALLQKLIEEKKQRGVSWKNSDTTRTKTRHQDMADKSAITKWAKIGRTTPSLGDLYQI